jgi:hypothetical protein
MRLDQVDPSTGYRKVTQENQDRVNRTTFGPPIRRVALNISSDTTSSTFTDNDIFDDGAVYISIQYVGSKPDGMLLVDSNGMWAGSGMESDASAIAAVPPSELIALSFDELYVISNDLREARALNEAAEKVIGHDPVSIPELRSLKLKFDAQRQAEWDAMVAEYYPDGLPEGEVLLAGEPIPSTSSSSLLSLTREQTLCISLLAAGATLVAFAAYRIRRERRGMPS